MQMLQATSVRPAVAARQSRAPRAAGRRLRVLAAGLSPEQQAFLERKAREARSASPAAAPTRGRSGSTRPPSVRPSSRAPAPAAPAPSYSPAPSAPAGGLSAEQQEFLARKAAEQRSASPAAAPTRGRSASPRPSSRSPAPPAAAAPSYSPAPSAPAGGLSAEQQEFLARKAAEQRSASPAAAPTRGRSSSARPSSRAPAPAASAPSYSPAPSAPAGGLSAEQQEFLARKAAEQRSASPAAAPTRGRSASPRPSSRSPAAAAPSSYSPPPPAAAPAASGLSAEQQAFLARKASEQRSPSPAAPTRGRSASPRPSSRQPTPAPANQPPPPRPEPRVTDVEFARAALERTLQEKTAVHPRDQVPPPSPPPPPAPRPAPVAMPQATGPSTGRWPDPAFFNETLAAFPAKAVCNAEEARCLIDAGYVVMDVRPELETNARGKLRGSVPVPCVFQRQQFDAQTNQMVTSEQDNPSFLAQVARKFPRKDARIIVACGNGKAYSIDVLEALEEEGYTNIVGLMGGFNAFFCVFDHRLNPKDGRPVARRTMKKLL